MTLGEKLSKLRKEHHYTQERLAEVLGVSRQTVSKWEGNLTYPETDKLIRVSELFQCSLDYLLKDGVESESPSPAADPDAPGLSLRVPLRERKSQRTLWGMPLWHLGKNAHGVIAIGYRARGILAIGLFARGVISFGLCALGLLSFGLCSLGLLSLGLISLGLLSAGCIAVGVLAAGSISLGIVSLGAVAVGDFSVGALAVGKYLAIGDRAQGMIALGDTQAAGSMFQKLGDLSPKEVAAVKALLNERVPSWLSWAKALAQFFL